MLISALDDRVTHIYALFMNKLCAKNLCVKSFFESVVFLVGGVMKASKVYGVFPNRRVHDMFLPRAVCNMPVVGGEVLDEDLDAVLDHTYQIGGNDKEGVFILSEEDRVSVYKRDKALFRRVL